MLCVAATLPLFLVAAQPAASSVSANEVAESQRARDDAIERADQPHPPTPQETRAQWDERDRRLRIATGLSFGAIGVGAGLFGIGIVATNRSRECSSDTCSITPTIGVFLPGIALAGIGLGSLVTSAILLRRHRKARPVALTATGLRISF